MSTDLLTRDGLASGQGGVWSYVSASRLNSWMACPLRWKLHYLDGITTPVTPRLFVGKCCHSMLETIYRHRQLGVTLDATDVSRRLLESWAELIDQEGMTLASVADEEAMRKRVVDLVGAYLKAIPADEPRPLAVEAALEAPLVDPVTAEDLGIPLVGIVDLILDGHEGPLVADFQDQQPQCRTAGDHPRNPALVLRLLVPARRAAAGGRPGDPQPDQRPRWPRWGSTATRPARKPISGGFLP